MQFLDDRSQNERHEARVEVIPAPYEATTSYGQGTKLGPQAILEASAQVEFYDEELDREPRQLGIETAAPIDFTGAVGEEAISRVEGAVAQSLARGRWPLVLGGEHSITSGAVRACLAQYPDLGVVQLDAHGDLRDTYEGSKWSHACVMRRIAELGCPTVGLGIRSICAEERAFIAAQKLPRWFAYAMAGSEAWIDEALAVTPQRVFLTIDVDGFDPSVIRSTGTPEPGGLEWYPTLRFLRRLFTERQVVGADIVELAPQQGDHASDFAAARLAYKLIGYLGEGTR